MQFIQLSIGHKPINHESVKHLKFGNFLFLLFGDGNVVLGRFVLRLACGFIGGRRVLNLFRPRPEEAVTGAEEVVTGTGGTVGRKNAGWSIYISSWSSLKSCRNYLQVGPDSLICPHPICSGSHGY